MQRPSFYPHLNSGLAAAELWAGAAIGVIFIVSFLLTGCLRRFAIDRSVLDIPNERSSHAVPTPRGGGLAIASIVLITLPLLAWADLLAVRTLWALLVGGGVVAAIGWIDDRGHVAARWRLGAHFAAAAWSVALIGGLPLLMAVGTTADFGWGGHLVAVLYLVWMLNLYNFMDGIDGLAGIEAATVCLGGAILFWLRPANGNPPWVLLFVASAVCGFLVWNFPQAKIFMGDVGSGFIGMALGILSLEAGRHAPQLFLGWVILLGAFIVDATLTLIRRLTNGERVHEAHRSHAYQRAARRLGSHVPVSLTFGVINTCWLLPLAALVVVERLPGTVGVLLAYAPLVWLALRQGAGEPDEGELAR